MNDDDATTTSICDLLAPVIYETLHQLCYILAAWIPASVLAAGAMASILLLLFLIHRCILTLWLWVLLPLWQAAGSFVRHRYYQKRYNELIAKIPSPPRSRIPFYGHIYLISKELKKLAPGSKSGEAFFNNQSKVTQDFWNEGLVNLNLGPAVGDTIVIWEADLYRDILTDNDNINKMYFYSLLSDVVGKGNLVTSDGDSWRMARKLTTPAFHFKVLEQFTTKFNEASLQFCDRVGNEVNVPDLYKVVSHFIMKSFMETTLGLEVTDQNEQIVDEYLHHVEGYNDCFEIRLTNPFYLPNFIYNLSTTGRKRTKHVEYLHKFTEKALRERMDIVKTTHENVISKSTKSCLADTLIREHLKTPKMYPIEYIRNQVDSFTFAGHETTSIALTNTLLLIAMHPEIQQKLFEELDANIPDIEYVSMDTFNNIKYLDAVLKESMRILPAASHLGRVVTKEFKLGKYTIPLGSNVVFNFYDLHRDPKYFEEPEKFNPDRFMPGCPERHPFSFLPFSGGLRNCIGQKYATNQLKNFIAKIVYNFELLTTVQMADIKLCQAVTLHIVNKIEIEFRARK